MPRLTSLRDIRRASGLPQKQIAEKMGVSVSTVRRAEKAWETNGKVSLENVFRFCWACGYEFDIELLTAPLELLAAESTKIERWPWQRR